jgi:hypothetical protein
MGSALDEIYGSQDVKPIDPTQAGQVGTPTSSAPTRASALDEIYGAAPTAPVAAAPVPAPAGNAGQSVLSTWGKVGNNPVGKVATDIGFMGAGEAAGAAVGSAAGFMVGGPLGAMAGGSAGDRIGSALGGGLAEALQTELGRYSGDYNKPRDEQWRDIQKAAMISLIGGKVVKDGGELLAAGARATPPQLAKALSHAWESTTDAGKEMLSGALAKLTNITPNAMKEGMSNAGEVLRKAKGYVSQAGGRDGGMELAAQDQVAQTEKLLDEGTKALPQLWRTKVTELAQQAGEKGFNVDPQEMVTGIQQAIEGAGLGKIVKGKNGLSFQPFTPAEVAAAKQAGLTGAQEISGEALTTAQRLTSKLDVMSRMGPLKNKQAVDNLFQFNKEINDITRATADSLDPSLKAVTAQYSQAFKNGVGSQFEKHGLKDAYMDVQKVYDMHGDQIGQARRLLNDPAGAERLASTIAKFDPTRVGARTQTTGDIVNSLQEVLGNRGTELMTNIKRADAAKQFIPLVSNRSGYLATGAGTAAMSGNLPLAGGLAAATPATSPALTLRTLAGLKWMASQRETGKLLGNDRALAEFLKFMDGGAEEQATMRDALLKHATSGGNGQQ